MAKAFPPRRYPPYIVIVDAENANTLGGHDGKGGKGPSAFDRPLFSNSDSDEGDPFVAPGPQGQPGATGLPGAPGLDGEDGADAVPISSTSHHSLYNLADGDDHTQYMNHPRAMSRIALGF